MTATSPLRSTVQPQSFPPDFLWGVATAAYQIEGATAEGGRTPSIWDTFAHTPGRIRDGDHGDIACDHYHRHAEDVALMADMGVGGYRFSISWSRLLPDGTGEVNPEGVAFYRRLCKDLLAAGITPNVTLYHWDLPQVLADRGGWLSPDSPDWFAAYAATAKAALGDLVQWWSTFNEPYVAAFLGHASGIHAPGITDPGAGFVAAHHMMVAHHRGVAALRGTDPDGGEQVGGDHIGIVLNLTPTWPAGEDPLDAVAADRVDTIHNRLFLEAVTAGRYPEAILQHATRYGVADRVGEDALAQAHAGAGDGIDWLGVNYYDVSRIAHARGAEAPAGLPGADETVGVTPPEPLTDMGWGVQPDGLSWMLRRVAAAHPDLPMLVCENGAAYPDRVDADGAVVDPDRIAYLDAHLGAVAEAIADGVDVRGYYVWSLLDNFEWAFGYGMRFGIVHVDWTTLQRTVKASGHWYRCMIAAHASAV
ncbi:MAG TPA: GH1 family beta-glucosidase [Euzebya sp.]|nr:GH1 family beta-glucosidase [Euzebya sp.]